MSLIFLDVSISQYLLLWYICFMCMYFLTGGWRWTIVSEFNIRFVPWYPVGQCYSWWATGRYSLSSRTGFVSQPPSMELESHTSKSPLFCHLSKLNKWSNISFNNNSELIKNIFLKYCLINHLKWCLQNIYYLPFVCPHLQVTTVAAVLRTFC